MSSSKRASKLAGREIDVAIPEDDSAKRALVLSTGEDEVVNREVVFSRREDADAPYDRR